MSDAALKRKWKRIRNPKAALAEIVEHEQFLGFDPYYTDLRNALLEMCERVLEKTK